LIRCGFAFLPPAKEFPPEATVSWPIAIDTQLLASVLYSKVVDAFPLDLVYNPIAVATIPFALFLYPIAREKSPIAVSASPRVNAPLPMDCDPCPMANE